MSKHNVQHFFRFKRVKMVEFGVSNDAKITQIKLEPDNRYLPVCSGCKKKLETSIPMSVV